MVALGLEELGALLVRLRLLLLGAVPDVLHREHRDDGEHLVGAAELDRLDEDLGERRLERELGHAAAEQREQPLLVERALSAKSDSIAATSVCTGGASMKSKWSRSLTPIAFICSTVLPRLVRWISGTDVGSISFL